MNIRYGWLPSGLIDQPRLQQCADLYSSHYGTWSTSAPRSPGERIRFTVPMLRKLLASSNSRLYYAEDGNGLMIGYAISVQADLRGEGVVTWVTQFVVHEAYRHKGIGTTLLFTIWGFSNHWAWGLVSANAYAVRALEKATRRRCSAPLICERLDDLLEIGAKHVPYISRDIETGRQSNRATLNTEFFVDHSTLRRKIETVHSSSAPWQLGGLDEGWEWCAFVFHDQEQIRLSQDELSRMLSASDQITAQAYSRMVLGPDQKWTRHAAAEAERIVAYCGLRLGATILDLGCGAGRHVLELAARGFEAVGVDYVGTQIEQARQAAVASQQRLASFVCDDVRNLSLNRQFDVVLCLYDVIGSYVDNTQNELIINNICEHLRPGGFALLSVMNFELTEAAATQRFSLSKDPDRLLSLAPSGTMEATGDVFNPSYYMLDLDSPGAVYRREQFTLGDALPVELLVRDRRFSKDGVETMCRDAGLDVVWSRYVQAGAWDRELANTDPKAKEILLLCRRRPEKPARQQSASRADGGESRSPPPRSESDSAIGALVRPKKISRSDMIGQAGVNLIAKTVNDMGFLWHPTGLEAGIDGYIEIRDPGTGAVTNCIIQVQSRATEREFLSENDESFDYLCDERDLAYWLGGNAPVILVRSRPSTAEAYWVSLKDYFRSAPASESRKVHFTKRTDRFDSSCAARLMALAIPRDAGIYRTQPPRDEVLVSNLLALVDHAPYVYRAPTEWRRPGALWQKMRDLTDNPASEWILDDEALYSFHDIRKEPWCRVCVAKETAQWDARGFAASPDPRRKQQFVRLLNQSLRAMLWRDDVAFHKDKKCYYFRSRPGARARKYGGRTVVMVHRSPTDPTRVAYSRHAAFCGQFSRYDEQWYLEITPTYLFTYDGYKVSRFHDKLLSGIKRLETQNKTHLAQVRLWAELLAPRRSLYDGAYPFLQFGALREFPVDFGFDDVLWLPPPARLEVSQAQKRLFIE